MGCLLSCLACEAASCACSGFGCLVGKAMKGWTGRVGYTVIFFLVAFLSWIVKGWGKDFLDWIPELNKINDMCTGDQPCIVFGVMAVYRFSFALTVFHLLHSVLMIGATTTRDPRVHLQNGFWLWKGLFLIGLLVAAFFIPNKFFEVFAYIALIGAFFFILAQLLYLVDFAHSWAESWIEKYENEPEEGRCSVWWTALLSATAGMYIVSLGLVIMMSVVYGKDPSNCEENVWFITINCVFAFLITVTAVNPKVQEHNPRSGVLQAGVVTIYSTYLVLSALLSEPKGDSGNCNPWYTSDGASNVILFTGAAFTIVAVVYSTLRAASQAGDTEHEPLVNKDEESGSHSDGDDCVSYNITVFHVFFMLGALYLGMLFTDWSIVDVQSENNVAVDTGYGAMWTKIVSSWICYLIYLWTLTGPVLFPDREWGYN